jgi:C4-dicarboxylate-specific signal transduction histidine kinase
LIEAGNPTQYQLEDLRAASESLQSELKRLGPLRTIRNEKKREFKVSQAINYALAIFKSKFAQLDINLDLDVDKDITIFARYSTLCQIIVNLIDNSIYWLQVTTNGDRKITIKVSSEYRMITIGDSGPGIDSAIRPYLFEAGYSMKVPPSGLGLYICKSYMQAMKGSIYETPANNRLKDICGAQFTIDFTHVPSRKEDDK